MNTSSNSLQVIFSFRRVMLRSLFLCLTSLLIGIPSLGVLAQDDVEIYEFTPYKVEVWCAFDSSVTASASAREMFQVQLVDELERTFRAAWQVGVSSMPEAVRPRAMRDFDALSVEALQQDDMVLVVSTSHETTKTARTLDAALEALESIAISSADLDALLAASAAFPDDELAASLVGKCQPAESAGESLVAGEIGAALLRRSALVSGPEVRLIPTPLAWQTETLLSARDKLFFLVVGMRGDSFSFQVRELDCPMQYFGPVVYGETADWPLAARTASSLVVEAFAPVARVEDATSTTGSLLLKAGGLILNQDNPARILVGDVLHPIIQRGNRKGPASKPEPQSWTFASVTQVDNEKLQANVYAYSGGTGLMGVRNRRTQRFVLRVRPTLQKSEIQVMISGTDQPQPGCFVYERDLLTDDYTLLGRTDWRGRFTVDVPETFGVVLPAEVRRKKYAAIRNSEAARVAAAKAAADAADSEEETPGEPEAGDENESEDAAGAESAEALAEAQMVEDALNTQDDEIALRAPLKQIYIKSGESVLAKLFMVPGMKAVEVAQLTDERRRLEIEAFVSGFQGEIVDLIGLRNLLAARIKLFVKQGKVEEAQASLDELQRLSTYSEMANRLVNIQRRFMDENSAPIPRSSKARIDRMFANTRGLLQKYLQDDLVNQSKRAVESAAGS